ncbi:MAG: hypothetical protein QM778_10370 [Myxococcales bacterium]
MRQSLRFVVSLSAVATVWGAGLSLASAQESSPQANTPSPGPVLPASPDTSGVDTTAGTVGSQGGSLPGYEPASPYMTTTETPAFTISDPNEPVIDAKTTRTRRPNLPLLGTSSLLFLGSYIPTIAYQGAKDRNDNLFVPIAGPWMDLSQGHHSTSEKTLLSLSGVMQGLGALGVVSSFFVPERRTRNWSLVGMRHDGRRASIVVEPRMAKGQYGFGAGGRF